MVVLKQEMEPKYSKHAELVSNMDAVDSDIISYAIFVIMSLLVITLVVLVIMICKHFGKLLMYEVAWLIVV